jgi:exosortase
MRLTPRGSRRAVLRLAGSFGANTRRRFEVPPLRLRVVAAAVATWPAWRWYARRMSDGGDEPWGLLALATAAWLTWNDDQTNSRSQQRALECGGKRQRDNAFGPNCGRGARRTIPPRAEASQGRVATTPTGPLLWPAAFLAIYTLGFPFLPPLIRAALAACVFGALLIRGPGAAGKWGLLALSLPIVATLQFYLGYPLRAFVAEVSAVALQVSGYAVTREGSLLHWAGETVMVDVPCSGVRMLWFGLYAGFLLAAWHRLSLPRTVVCAVAAFSAVLAANAVRATILFFKESHLVQWPEWTHAGVGLVLFAGTMFLIAAAVRQLQPRSCAP